MSLPGPDAVLALVESGFAWSELMAMGRAEFGLWFETWQARRRAEAQAMRKAGQGGRR